MWSLGLQAPLRLPSVAHLVVWPVVICPSGAPGQLPIRPLPGQDTDILCLAVVPLAKSI